MRSAGPYEGRLVIVCTANIIRSPFVAALLRAGVDAMEGRSIDISSAGVASREERPADPRVRQLGEMYGVDLDGHRSRPLEDALLAGAPTVLCAERAHRRAVLDRRPELVSSVFTVREFARLVRSREAGSPSPAREWNDLVRRAAAARVTDRLVPDDDDIVDPVMGDAPVWVRFEKQAVNAVSEILAAIADLPPVGAGEPAARLLSRREYRRSLAGRS